MDRDQGQALTGPSAALAIVRLSPARRDDFLRFFDRQRDAALAASPERAKCYCRYHHVAAALDWSALDAAANRRAMAARIDVGEMEGFLACSGDEVVGWVNAQPWHKLPHACARMRIAPVALPVPAHEAAAIVCFVVAPQWRRRGVARALLDGALASFAERGIRLVDAFPRSAGDGAVPGDRCRGTLSMFVAAGFAPLREEAGVAVVRRRLGDGA